jgi:hypothetical protein
MAGVYRLAARFMNTCGGSTPLAASKMLAAAPARDARFLLGPRDVR